MLRIDDAQGPVVKLFVDGKLKAEDYDAFLPTFERLMRERDEPLPMRIELGEGFDGWSLAGLSREVNFGARYRHGFGPIAVIGDSRWERWSTELSAPFLDAPVRFFRRKDAAQADVWLREQIVARVVP